MAVGEPAATCECSIDTDRVALSEAHGLVERDRHRDLTDFALRPPLLDQLTRRVPWVRGSATREDERHGAASETGTKSSGQDDPRRAAGAENDDAAAMSRKQLEDVGEHLDAGETGIVVASADDVGPKIGNLKPLADITEVQEDAQADS